MKPRNAARIWEDPRRDPSEVPSDAWLNRWDTSRVRRVLEHPTSVPSYGAVISFLELELEASENLEEEDEALLQELDPNGFDSRSRRNR